MTQYFFCTRSLPLFTNLHELWYIQDLNTNKYRKRVPFNIEDMFTEVSLAYWFMDDGYFDTNKKIIIFCTENFSKEECIILQNLLFKLNIKTSLYLRNKNKDTYRIRLTRKSTVILVSLIKSYIHPILPSDIN